MVYSAKGRKKSFSVFDCDSHVNEPVEVWDKYIPSSQRAFAKTHFFRDIDHATDIINGKVSVGNQLSGRSPEAWHPGLTKEIIGPMRTDSPEWDEKIGRNASGRDPYVRLNDMDAAGVDQGLIFPTFMVHMPRVRNADAARIVATAYNDWANDYCSADRKRLFPCAVLPTQNLEYAIEELRRVAKLGFKAAVVRPVIHWSNQLYPTYPEFDPLWREFEELDMALGMHTFPASEPLSEKLAQRMATGMRKDNGDTPRRPNQFVDTDIEVYSPGQFADNIMKGMGSISSAGQALSFNTEAINWTTIILMSGWLEKFPRLKPAILESNATWLPMVLEKCETFLKLHQHVRDMADPPVKIGDPREIFYRQCYIAFESDEDIVFRTWDLYENIALWSSDMPHHDAADVWEAIDNMNKRGVPEEVQAKMLGDNARRLYGIESYLCVTEAPEEYSPVTLPRLIA